MLKNSFYFLFVFTCLTFIFISVLFIFYANNYGVVLNKEKLIAQTLAPNTLPVSSIDLKIDSSLKNQEVDLIAGKADFIKADLSAMKIYLYQDGQTLRVFDILTKGKEGSWWETPVGLYSVESKEPSHFSTIGKVYMPWSIQFQGNFFIHGWPYYESGQPVASSYSGGCIRLNTGDARQVFDFAKSSMPILVLDKNTDFDNFTYSNLLPSQDLDLSSDAILVADLKSGSIILGKNITKPLPIASLTKLMTALVASEYINLERFIYLSPHLNSIYDTSFALNRYYGRRVRVFDLLYPMLLESSNAAAESLKYALGVDLSGLMNKKAYALNMVNSQFADLSGASESDISTAKDLFYLARYLYYNRSFILKITQGQILNPFGQMTFKNLKNLNNEIGAQGFLGGKIGKTTAAKETILSILNVKVKASQETRPIVVILLGSSDRWRDEKIVINYLSNSYFEKILTAEQKEKLIINPS